MIYCYSIILIDKSVSISLGNLQLLPHIALLLFVRKPKLKLKLKLKHPQRLLPIVCLSKAKTLTKRALLTPMEGILLPSSLFIRSFECVLPIYQSMSIFSGVRAYQTALTKVIKEYNFEQMMVITIKI